MVTYIVVMSIGSTLSDPTVIALIGTLFGGVGLKAVEHWLNKNKVKIDDAARIRDELRTELTAVRAENRQLESDVDKWRKEYYDMYEKNIRMRTEAQIQGVKFTQEDLKHPD